MDIRFTPETAGAKTKRPVWQVVAIALAVVLAVAAFLWLVIDPFAESPETSFEGARLMVDRQTVPVEPQRRIGQDDCVFTVMDADLREMTVTIGLSKPLYSEGKEYRKLKLRYDEEMCLYDTKEQSLSTDEYAELKETRVRIVFPDLTETDRDGLQDVTVYRLGDMTVAFHKEYYAWDDGGTILYGTYTRDGETLTLRETAGVARDVFVRDGNHYRYDAKASYRHKAAHTPALQDGAVLHCEYRTQVTRGENRKYQWVLYAADGTELVRETDMSHHMVSCTMEDHDVVRVEMQHGNKWVRFIRLTTGEVSKAYSPVIAEAHGGIVWFERGTAQTTVTLEPIPWCDDPVPKTLTVSLPADYYGDMYVSGYIGEDNFVVAYGSVSGGDGTTMPFDQATNAVVLTLDGEAVTAPLVVTDPGHADESGNLIAANVTFDGDSQWRVNYYGITGAYRLRGDTYWDLRYELKNGTLTPDRLRLAVLDDIAAGRATQTVHPDGRSFTACYGGAFENITFWYGEEQEPITIPDGDIGFYVPPTQNKVYIGAVPPLS